MVKPAIRTGLLVVAFCCTGTAQGQEATERFIPIGRSPGLSDATSVGKISSSDPASLTLTVSGPQAGRGVEITERTRIWLDRSTIGKTNLTGSIHDCRPGRTVEIKYEDPERRRAAWVKVKVGEAEAATTLD